MGDDLSIIEESSLEMTAQAVLEVMKRLNTKVTK
jgi:hypothetical protein